jgi:hypothetical protein
MSAKDRLEQQLRAAAAREMERSRARRPRLRLPAIAMPVAGTLAVLLLAVLVAAPLLRGPSEPEREAAPPKRAPVAVPVELLGSFHRGDVTVIFDFDRYTIELGDAAVHGDAAAVPAGLQLTHDGAGDCGTASPTPAVYAYRFRGGALTFTALDDDCAARRRALTGGPFRRGG